MREATEHGNALLDTSAEQFRVAEQQPGELGLVAFEELDPLPSRIGEGETFVQSSASIGGGR